MNHRPLLALMAGLGLAAAAQASFAAQPAADLVLQNARIYTADAHRSMAEALAVKDGKLVYVGSVAGAKAYIGPKTTVEDAQGRLVLPGLVDAHIHPSGWRGPPSPAPAPARVRSCSVPTWCSPRPG